MNIKTLPLLLALALLSACGSNNPESVQSGTNGAGSDSAIIPPTTSAPGRLMIIGLDGARAEALDLASMPNLDALRSGGSVDLNAITGDVSLSGPGWASMLTGVWCTKHNVLDNDATWSQSRFDTYPHFITRLEAQQPNRRTFSVSHWNPINDEILCADERDDMCGGADQVLNVDTDLEVRDAVVAELSNNNPDVIFMQFDDIDHAGHGDPPFVTDPGGFCPFPGGDIAEGDHNGSCTPANFNQNYLDSLAITDGYIGDILAALYARPNYAQERWLVLVSPDHGGGGQFFNQHGFPHEQDRRTFLIAGGTEARAFPNAQIKMVDIAATALFHLGVTIEADWNLDGRPVGVSGAPSYEEVAIPSCFNQTSGMGDGRTFP